MAASLSAPQARLKSVANAPVPEQAGKHEINRKQLETQPPQRWPSSVVSGVSVGGFKGTGGKKRFDIPGHQLLYQSPNKAGLIT